MLMKMSRTMELIPVFHSSFSFFCKNVTIFVLYQSWIRKKTYSTGYYNNILLIYMHFQAKKMFCRTFSKHEKSISFKSCSYKTQKLLALRFATTFEFLSTEFVMNKHLHRFHYCEKKCQLWNNDRRPKRLK